MLDIDNFCHLFFDYIDPFVSYLIKKLVLVNLESIGFSSVTTLRYAIGICAMLSLGTGVAVWEEFGTGTLQVKDRMFWQDNLVRYEADILSKIPDKRCYRILRTDRFLTYWESRRYLFECCQEPNVKLPLPTKTAIRRDIRLDLHGVFRMDLLLY